METELKKTIHDGMPHALLVLRLAQQLDLGDSGQHWCAVVTVHYPLTVHLMRGDMCSALPFWALRAILDYFPCFVAVKLYCTGGAQVTRQVSQYGIKV